MDIGLAQFSDFNMAKIIAWTIFGGAGFVAFMYGKKSESFRPMIIGIALTAALYFFRE